MTHIAQRDFDLLRDFIREQCGISVSDDKSYLIESRLAHLVAATGARDFGEFYLKAKQDGTGALRDNIVDAVTTHETLWFRDTTPWVTIREVMLREWIADLEAGRKAGIRIWSAACSTGQEPYSLAMAIDEALAGRRVAPNRFEILATDISAGALFVAMSGRYNQIAMSRGLEARYRTRYFTQKGPIWECRSRSANA